MDAAFYSVTLNRAGEDACKPGEIMTRTSGNYGKVKLPVSDNKGNYSWKAKVKLQYYKYAKVGSTAVYTTFYINVDVTGASPCPPGDVISYPVDANGDVNFDTSKTAWYNSVEPLGNFNFYKFTGSDLCTRKYKVSTSDT